jgi:hypothetical protein
MNEFLNPKSMLTPGIAGALVMFLSNAIVQQFPEIAFRYVALGLSLLVGGLVFTATAMEIIYRVGFWLINSLIIFAMGVGSSNIGANLTQDKVAADNPGLEVPTSFEEFFISSSWAQPGATEGHSQESQRKLEELRMEQERLRNEIQRLESEKARIKNGTKPDEKPEPERQKFFQRW